MTPPTLHLVGDLAQSSLDAVETLSARVAELEAQLHASEQRASDAEYALRRVADLAHTAAASATDRFAVHQLNALAVLALGPLEKP